VGDLAEKPIREFAAKTQSLEARKRCLSVLEKFKLPFITDADRLRNVRAIQVLGRINNEESQKLLTALSQGTPAAKETHEARRQSRKR
jgi:hypothetical protein